MDSILSDYSDAEIAALEIQELFDISYQRFSSLSVHNLQRR